MSTLRVYEDGNGCDTFVAADLEDLRKVKAVYLGCPESEPWDPLGDMGVAEEFHEVPAGQVIKIRDDEYHGCAQAKTAAEWAASNGRGLLCSTEY